MFNESLPDTKCPINPYCSIMLNKYHPQTKYSINPIRIWNIQ